MGRPHQSRMCLVFVAIVAGLLAMGPVMAADDRWWPIQHAPRVIVRTTAVHASPELQDAYQFLMQSVAGLAAQAVNESKLDELIWVSTGSPEFEGWYRAAIHRQPQLATAGEVNTWELVDRYRDQGIIKGYLLYRRDISPGELNDHRRGLDHSVNVATSLAGVLGGIIVDERLEKDAKSHGLTLLVDVRDKTQAWCFDTFKDQFNRKLLCCQDPKKPHARDLAIAHRALTLYGNDDPLERVLDWLQPPSPILGWNGGDEFQTTLLTSSYGHFQTASDWCMNLPILMAGSHEREVPKFRTLEASQIDWSEKRSGVCFINTDGDNIQWLEGNFFRDTSYWANPLRGKIPFGWSCCFTHLTQLCPVALDYAAETITKNDSFVEWGGGYYYPDHFGSRRSNGAELLAEHARRTWKLMLQTNTRIIGFNVDKVGSPDALKSYQTFAGETDGLLAILAFQYSPYEGGEGQTYWVKDRNGIEIPVITARYSIWENVNQKTRRLAGTPAKVTRVIRESVEGRKQDEMPRFDWVAAHVWSYFKPIENASDTTEDMPQAMAPQQGGVRGLTPFLWCAQRLPTEIRVISPEEMSWRIRMQHNPAQTKKLFKN